MARPSVRHRIVEMGTAVLLERGFSATGVQDITAAAGVPKGSFYNHFESKEAFGAEALRTFFADLQTTIRDTLDNQAVPPLRRLQDYFAAIIAKLDDQDYAYGCLIGNFSIELSPLSDRMRAELQDIFAHWVVPFRRCVAEAQAAGSIRNPLPPAVLADFILAAWHGAILRMKIERNREPLEQFRTVIFDSLLNPP